MLERNQEIVDRNKAVLTTRTSEPTRADFSAMIALGFVAL